MDYGGRYFGYLIVIIMTRSKCVAALCMGGVLTAIGISSKKLIGHWWAFGLTLIMLFLLPREVFAQSISWTSGFANYATTTLIVLLFLNLVKNTLFERREERWFNYVSSLMMGFLGSLILENITIYLVSMSIIVQIILFVKKRRFSWSLFWVMIGAGVGAVLMFSNSAYWNIVVGQDTYRSMATSALGLMDRMKTNFTESIYRYGLFKNIVINFSLALSGTALLTMDKTKRRGAVFSLGVFFSYLTYTFICEVVIGGGYETNLLIIIDSVFSLLAIISLIVFSILISKRGTVFRRMMWIVWVSFLFIMAPLLFITPIGPRNFLITDLLLMEVAFIWTAESLRCFYIVNRRAYKQLTFIGRRIELIVAVSIWVIYTGLFVLISRADTDRLRRIRKESDEGNKTIVINTLPYESLMWESTPRNEIFKERYKLFYDLPEDIDLIVEE